MTITTNDTRNEYTATGGQTVFNYTFKIFDSGDLNVYQTAAGATANDATDLITAYTVTGVGNSAGGTVVLDSGATAGDLITIVSAIDDTRTTDYQNNGDFLASTVNNDFDRTVSLVKQLKNTIDRTPQFEESEQGATGIKWAAPVTGGFLRWNATLDQIENVVLNTAEDATNAAAVSVSDSGGYFTGTDVEAVTQELGDDVADLATLSGVAAGSTNLGTFTGTIITDNTNTKTALQELETQANNNWVLLSTTTPSGVTDITLDSATYASFLVRFTDVFVNTSGQDFDLQLGHTGGTVFFTGATDYTWINDNDGGTVTYPARGDIRMSESKNSDGNEFLNGELELSLCGNSNTPTFFKGWLARYDTSLTTYSLDVISGGILKKTTAIDTLRMAASSFAGGTVKLYGKK